jgi:hypothetical protein
MPITRRSMYPKPQVGLQEATKTEQLGERELELTTSPATELFAPLFPWLASVRSFSAFELKRGEEGSAPGAVPLRALPRKQASFVVPPLGGLGGRNRLKPGLQNRICRFMAPMRGRKAVEAFQQPA